MNMKKLLLLSLLIFSTLAIAETQLNLESKIAKKYKTLLTTELKNGPNFAKTFRLVQIGCGSGCSHLALVDTTTGKARDTEIFIHEHMKTGNNGRVIFNLESDSLTLRGCLKEEQPASCGEHEYELSDLGQLKKLSSKPF